MQSCQEGVSREKGASAPEIMKPNTTVGTKSSRESVQP